MMMMMRETRGITSDGQDPRFEFGGNIKYVERC